MHHLNIAPYCYPIQACPSSLDGSIAPLSVDLSSSEQFIDILTGGIGVCTFQTFSDRAQLKVKWPYPSILHGTLN